MRNSKLGALALTAALAACGGGNKGGATPGDTLARDLQLAPTDTSSKLSDRPAAAAPAPATPARRPAVAAMPVPGPAAPKPEPPPSLPAGTVIGATARDTVTSRVNKAGGTMVVVVGADAKDAEGRVVIPAGAEVTLRIDTLRSESAKGKDNQALHLTPVSVAIGGSSRPIRGTVDSVGYILKGRGITGGTVAKVGAGAVAGAILGKLIGKNTTGAVVGGAAGAAAGAAIADRSGDQDVTIYPGSVVILRLTEPFAK
jgi:hypothetical protein